MTENKANAERLMSQVFSLLRFPLIVGVIFIHSAYTTSQTYPEYLNDQGVIGCVHGFYIFYYLTTLFSQVLARLSVPILFFMSGFLFFYKVDSFGTDTWLLKLTKRIRSLFIPYLFWNIAFVALFWLLIHVPLFSGLIDQSIKIDGAYIYKALIGQPSADGTQLFPIDYPLWFVRDLFVCAVLSPLIFWIVQRLKWIAVLSLGLIWYFDVPLHIITFGNLSSVAIFFFSFGAWLSLNNKNVVSIARDLKLLAWLYPIIACVDCLTKHSIYTGYIHRAGILAGVVLVFCIAAWLVEKKNVRAVPLLTSASFFVYAIHEPMVLSQVSKITTRISIGGGNELILSALYLVNVVITIAIALLIYIVLKKLTPRFLQLINGGRA